MKCKEIVRLLTYGRDNDPDAHYAITQHTFTCPKCREELAINSAIKAIIKSHSLGENDIQGFAACEETRLVNQVKARIQSARENGIGTWESAVISMRGWLVGFAAAAVLLLALSGQLAFRDSTDKKEEGRLDLISTAPVPSASEDLISSNTQTIRQSELTSEEVENVR